MKPEGGIMCMVVDAVDVDHTIVSSTLQDENVHGI